MARQRVMVGIGEALLCEYPDRVEAGGLAVQCARHAMRLGHLGVLVSRIGQDQAGDELLKQLRAMKVNIDALQSDPDLPTGRLVVRSIGGRTTRALTARAAFDNLQWDFDLVDVAQQADAVIFGELARREGQSRSIIKRFLAECRGAVRVFDTTNRGGQAVDRVEVRSGLEFAEGLIVDAESLKALVPGWDGKQTQAAVMDIMRGSGLAFVASIERGDCSEMLTVHDAKQSWPAKQHQPTAQHEAAVVGLLHGLLSGWDFAKCVELAGNVAEHAASHPDKPMPQAG